MTSKPVEPAQAPALSAEDVHIRLGKREIVRGATLELRGGRVLGVLGPSGAGKTTLFRGLTGEVAIRSGTVRLGQVDVTRMPLWSRARHGLGYVPQTPSVLLDLTVEKNIVTFARMVGSAGVSVAEQAKRVGLGERLRVRAGELSGGERRRLEVLRALMGKPAVLICDEPFAGVDPASSHDVGDLLREHADSGGAVVLADHRVGEALRICDWAHLLVEGHVEVSVEPAEFAQHPAVQQRYLG